MTEHVHGAIYTDKHDSENWSLFTHNDIVSLGDTIVDVGACQGVYLHMFISLMGATGKIHAIEMMPQNYEFLQLRCGHLPNVEFYNLAVSDKDDWESIYITDTHETCGIMESNGTKIGNITSTTLDTLLQDEGEIDLIKIDVEGAELKVLQGMKEVIKRTKQILVEIHNDEIWDEIRDILIEKNDFSCYDIERKRAIDNTSPRPYQCFCRRES